MTVFATDSRLIWVYSDEQKLPANDPSFLEKSRKENDEKPLVRIDDLVFNKLLKRVNPVDPSRPHSAPPRQRGGGRHQEG